MRMCIGKSGVGDVREMLVCGNFVYKYLGGFKLVWCKEQNISKERRQFPPSDSPDPSPCECEEMGAKICSRSEHKREAKAIHVGAHAIV
jgi:hypothetical protein